MYFKNDKNQHVELSLLEFAILQYEGEELFKSLKPSTTTNPILSNDLLDMVVWYIEPIVKRRFLSQKRFFVNKTQDNLDNLHNHYRDTLYYLYDDLYDYENDDIMTIKQIEMMFNLDCDADFESDDQKRIFENLFEKEYNIYNVFE